jgi:hypothetical protein
MKSLSLSGMIKNLHELSPEIDLNAEKKCGVFLPLKVVVMKKRELS